MKTKLNKLIDKYETQRGTIHDLIEATNATDELHEMGKYRVVFRFISQFISELKLIRKSID